MPRLLTTDSLAAWQERGAPMRLLDVRLDVWTYLKGHLPQAQYLNIETLRASRGGVPVQLLDTPWYRELFKRLGLDPTVPVVVYSAGETLNIDATFAVWILASMGHPQVYLLDGGFAKWSLEGREVPREYPGVAPAGRWWNSRGLSSGSRDPGRCAARHADRRPLRRCPPARPVRWRGGFPDAAGPPAWRGQSLVAG
jgi:rhodanese-related sulfurtransferase